MNHVWYLIPLKKLAKSSKILQSRAWHHGIVQSCIVLYMILNINAQNKTFFILFCSRFINLPHDITVFVSVSNFRQASCSTALLCLLLLY